MPPKNQFRLTAEQQALSLQRQRNRLLRANNPEVTQKVSVLQRKWQTVPNREPSKEKYRFNLMTWNVRSLY